MTPTPEEIALAELIARDVTEESGGYIFNAAHDAALTTIMEVSKKAAAFLEGKAARNETTAAWTESLSVRKNSKRDARKRISDAQAIRNGEHLR